MSAEKLLEVSDLQIRYGAAVAVRGATFHIRRGELIAVIGNNGAGKTSILRGVSGLVRPAGGSVRFKGTDTTQLGAHKKVGLGLALIPEGRMIFPDQTVEGNLILGAYGRWSSDRAAVMADMERVFELFPRLKERLAQPAGSLSGGEQQMLAIGRGLLSKPELLMIDELSLGLAPKIVDQLLDVLRDLNAQGLTILLVEQLAAQALAIADRAYVVANGQTTMEGAARDLLNDRQVMEAFLGTKQLPSTNHTIPS
jgi:branched-chain amino acid transport system ATP-binding protein